MFSHIHFQTIGVTDYQRALEFYRDKLGFTVERDSPYGEGRWIFLKIPEAATMLHFDKVSKIEPQKTPALILVTKNVDGTCKALEAAGVAIKQGPADAPWNPGTRWAMIDDSEGNLVLIQTI
jgi:predicted enzyme related to lactoylglutathione lyase